MWLQPHTFHPSIDLLGRICDKVHYTIRGDESERIGSETKRIRSWIDKRTHLKTTKANIPDKKAVSVNGAKSLPEQGFNWRAKCKIFPWENNSKDRKNKQP